MNKVKLQPQRRDGFPLASPEALPALMVVIVVAAARLVDRQIEQWPLPSEVHQQ